MTEEIVDPIKAFNEQYSQDCAMADKVLFAIRSGAEVRIMHDPMTGWEMQGEGLPCYMPFNTGEQLVNMILMRLAHQYRLLSAVLGNPDRHDVSLLTLK